MIFALTMSFSMENFIYKHESELKGAVGYFPFFMAAVFLYKGITTYRRNKRLKETTAPPPPLEESLTGISGVTLEPLNMTPIRIETEGNIEDSDAEEQELLTDDEGRVYDEEEMDRQREKERIEAEMREKEQREREEREKEQKEQEKLKEKEESISLTGNKGSGNETKFMRYRRIFLNWLAYKSPVMSKVRNSGQNMELRLLLSLVTTGFLGAICGLIYFGGGIVFSASILLAWQSDVKFSAGTGAFIMSSTMLALSFTFIQRSFDTPPGILIAHILIPVVASITGSILGVKFVMRVSETTVFFCVFVILTLLGIFSTLEYYVIAPNT